MILVLRFENYKYINLKIQRYIFYGFMDHDHKFFYSLKDIVSGKYTKLFFHNLRVFLKNDYLRTVFFIFLNT